ncbi:MAG: hypothetical protein JXA42_01025 [Anaerolineales bacterium]|nr:hypothetical protein [Anaerolineales bacterium]
MEERFPIDLTRLLTLFMLLFGLVAVAFVYWSVIRAPGLLTRDDNPRLVEEELRVDRGEIIDRKGVVLAKTAGELGSFYRSYLLPCSPVVGYYSLRYGVAGIESTYDDILRGQSDSSWTRLIDSTLHRYPVGWNVQLTLDAKLQSVAEDALGDLTGAIVLLDASSGNILSVVSHPGFDPNQLDEQFGTLNEDENAPLWNRALQGLFQPGSAFQPFVLGMVLEEGLANINDPIQSPSAAVQVDNVWVNCVAAPPEESSLSLATGFSCPAPYNELAVEMDWSGFIQSMEKFGFFDTLSLPLVLAKGAQSETLENGIELRAEVLGQGNMTTSPLEMAWALTTIANNGERLPLQLVQRVGSDANGWEVVVPSVSKKVSRISPQTIEQIKTVMLESVANGAANNARSDDVRIAGHVGIAVTGPDKANQSWFLGFTPTDSKQNTGRYVVVVLLEEVDDGALAAGIGGRILKAAAGQ